jgi:hypothetical protein
MLFLSLGSMQHCMSIMSGSGCFNPFLKYAFAHLAAGSSALVSGTSRVLGFAM